MRDIKLFAGSASQTLTTAISKKIKVPVSKSTVRIFADGELKVSRNRSATLASGDCMTDRENKHCLHKDRVNN